MFEDRLYDQSLPLALLHSFWRPFYYSAAMIFMYSALQISSPIITRLLLDYLIEAYAEANYSGVAGIALPQARGTGYGIALVIGLFLVQLGGASELTGFLHRQIGPLRKLIPVVQFQSQITSINMHRWRWVFTRGMH